jgi:hypothetical protein
MRTRGTETGCTVGDLVWKGYAYRRGAFNLPVGWAARNTPAEDRRCSFCPDVEQTEQNTTTIKPKQSRLVHSFIPHASFSPRLFPLTLSTPSHLHLSSPPPCSPGQPRGASSPPCVRPRCVRCGRGASRLVHLFLLLGVLVSSSNQRALAMHTTTDADVVCDRCRPGDTPRPLPAPPSPPPSTERRAPT